MNVFITGGNRGLGLELVLHAAGRGHHVFATVRDAKREEQLTKALEQYSELQGYVTVFYADVRNEESIAAAAAQLRELDIRLNCIINSAGMLVGRETDIESLDIKDLENSFDVNLFGPIRVAKHLISLLSEAQASVINISSVAGSFQHAYGGDYPYGLSKSGLNMFSLQLKHLLAERGVDVWSIHPGWMRTDMGGSQAPLSPSESAASIIDMMERKIKIPPELCFIDYTGQPMPL